MNQVQLDVLEFMKAADQPFSPVPIVPPREVRKLHASLILEEAMETIHAMGFELVWEISEENPRGHYVYLDTEDGPNLTEIYDGLADTSYVVNGAANAFGLDLQAGHDEAHRSNMSKFIDGYRRDDGKWIKGPSYSKADFATLIGKQITEFVNGTN